MLAKKYRLTKNLDFERIEKEGKVAQSESFGLSICSPNGLSQSRFGFVVSTKIAKESVQRNRIKRALSEAVRQLMADINPGFDVVFLAKQIALRKSTYELMRETREALKNTGIAK